MKKSIAEDLKEFTKKHNAKLTQMKNFEDSFLRDKEKFLREKSDVFKWLKIKTPYQCELQLINWNRHEELKKKLREKLVETVSDVIILDQTVNCISTKIKSRLKRH